MRRFHGSRSPLNKSALTALAVLLASCAQAGTPRTTGTTASPLRFEVGVAYPHKLYVHCGVHGTHFAGRDWDASPPLESSHGNPPVGWDQNEEQGTMTLETPNRARFRSSNGDRTATFIPRPEGSPDRTENCE